MSVIDSLNMSPYVSGCAMILMNVGGKYLHKDLPDTLDDIFENKLARRLVVFAIGFMATRDIRMALIITLVFIFVFSHLLDTKSNYCIIKKVKKIE